MLHVVEIEVAGRPLRLETGRMAKLSDGAVLASYGDTVVLATAVSSQTVRPSVDFLPLTVNYQEKAYAAGKIPGGYFKREGRPSEKEVGITAGSAALTLSHIPFSGPVAGVKIGRVNGRLVVNPDVATFDAGELQLVVAGTADAVMMVEAGAHELPESVMIEAIELAHAEIKKSVEMVL